MRCRHDLDHQESAGAVLGPSAYSPPNSGSDSDEAKQPGNTQSEAVQGKPYPEINAHQYNTAVKRFTAGKSWCMLSVP